MFDFTLAGLVTMCSRGKEYKDIQIGEQEPEDCEEAKEKMVYQHIFCHFVRVSV